MTLSLRPVAEPVRGPRRLQLLFPNLIPAIENVAVLGYHQGFAHESKLALGCLRLSLLKKSLREEDAHPQGMEETLFIAPRRALGQCEGNIRHGGARQYCGEQQAGAQQGRS